MRITCAMRRTAWLGLSLLLIQPAGAAATPESRYEDALAAVLADVGNPDKSFDFVQAAIDVGDLRGAAGALERILLIDPRLANIQLELGVLYLRLGNAELGRYHIAQALRAPNVPTLVRSRAERYLAAASAASKRNFFHGYFSLGYRYETNANAAPDSPFVSVTDPFLGRAVTAQLSPTALERDDSSMQGSLVLSHAYAFSAASSWDSDLIVSGLLYDEMSELGQLSGRLETGPTFAVAGTLESQWQLRPFVTAGQYQLDGEDFISAYGGGLELRKTSRSRAVTSLRLQYTDQEFDDLYDNGIPVRVVSDRSGDYYSGDLAQVWQLGRAQFGLLLTGETADTKAQYQSFDRYGGGMNLRVFVGGAQYRAPWSFFLTGLWRDASYQEPDPMIDPDRDRKDTRVDFAAGIDVPVSRAFSITLTGTYTKNDSNLPNFDFDNSAGSIAFVGRF